jgi:hypothetical protein
MKTKHLLLLLCGLCTSGIAQNKSDEVKEYTTFIYTSDDLAEEIQEISDDDRRTFGAALWESAFSAVKGIGGGYITSFVDMGVNAVGLLVTRNSRLKTEWEQTVSAENTWTTNINSIQEVKDFYKKPSQAGALDPKDMTFDGIGCIRKEGKDTVFFISCHIDRSKLNRIVDHSKFELVLDTLIISPTHSNLPNTRLPIEFSFDERKNFTVQVNVKIYSSWFTELIELHENTQLGEFTLNVPIDPTKLKDGYLRYTRRDGEQARYEVVGESFIVPRSYMGFRDKNGNYTNIWGTGQYKLDITLTEKCDITDAYREHWKSDRKKREKMQPKNGVMTTVWQTVSKQKWDELGQQWVITTLTAPAGIISNELIEDMGLNTSGGINATASSPAATPTSSASF